MSKTPVLIDINLLTDGQIDDLFDVRTTNENVSGGVWTAYGEEIAQFRKARGKYQLPTVGFSDSSGHQTRSTTSYKLLDSGYVKQEVIMEERTPIDKQHGVSVYGKWTPMPKVPEPLCIRKNGSILPNEKCPTLTFTVLNLIPKIEIKLRSK